jgi:hypothetical protein
MSQRTIHHRSRILPYAVSPPVASFVHSDLHSLTENLYEHRLGASRRFAAGEVL